MAFLKNGESFLDLTDFDYGRHFVVVVVGIGALMSKQDPWCMSLDQHLAVIVVGLPAWWP